MAVGQGLIVTALTSFAQKILNKKKDLSAICVSTDPRVDLPLSGHTDLQTCEYRDDGREEKAVAERRKKRGGKGKQGTKRPRPVSNKSVDLRVVKALAHPLRQEILAILNDRMGSPNELSKELEEGLSQVSYHVKVLKDFDMIELIKTEPRRGAVEHFYRANAEVFITSEHLKLMPKSAQSGVWRPVMSDIEQDVSTSLKAGTFDNRPDFVVGRVPRILDGKAREDAEELSGEYFERYKQLEVDSDLRRQNGEGDGEEIPTTAVVLVFGSALGKKLKPKKGKKR